MLTWKLIAIACVGCLVVVHEAATPAIKTGAGIVGFVLMPILAFAWPAPARERWWVAAMTLGAIVSFAIAEFGQVRAAMWGVLLFGAMLAVPPFVKVLVLAFRVIRNALRIRVLLRAGAAPELIDDLTRL
jgi:hypothetical protein